MNAVDLLGRDRQLARAASSNDGVALRRVIELVAPSVLAGVRSISGASHPDVDDVVQESLVSLVRALPTYRGEATLVHFAKQIAIRRALDALRSTIRARRNQAALDTTDEAIAAEPALLEQQKVLWRTLLAELPEAQAEVLALRAIEGCTIKEIADVTAAPIETVRSRLRLAKATLRDRIGREPAYAALAPGEDDHDDGA